MSRELAIGVVVQRYGVDIAGGAEQAARGFCERLAGRGHRVEVLTSCARSYVDWADHYPPGRTELDGVGLTRLPVTAPRDDHLFAALHARAASGARPAAPVVGEAWVIEQGPCLTGYAEALGRLAATVDVVLLFTYLYWPTWAGLRLLAGRVPTALHPCAHDEPAFWLPVFDEPLRLADAMAFFTEEEEQLLHARLRGRVDGSVVGIGVESPAPTTREVEEFRRRVGIGSEPYLVYVGRVDPAKGATELFDSFVELKARRPGPLKLVMVGEPVRPLPPHPDVVATGWVDRGVRDAAVGGSVALVQPSYFESFSLVLAEAWLLGVPALVQGRCAVLAGQARRSRGGIPYTGFREFEAAVELLVERPELRRTMGESGRRYTEARYSWDRVLDQEEAVLARAMASFEHRRPLAARPAGATRCEPAADRRT